jgi:hypothetical protein
MFNSRPPVWVLAPILDGKLVLLKSGNHWRLPHSHDQSHPHEIYLGWMLEPFFEAAHVRDHTLITPPLSDFSLNDNLYTCTFLACNFSGILRPEKANEVAVISKGNLVPHIFVEDMRPLIGIREFESHLS